MFEFAWLYCYCALSNGVEGKLQQGSDAAVASAVSASAEMLDTGAGSVSCVYAAVVVIAFNKHM